MNTAQRIRATAHTMTDEDTWIIQCPACKQEVSKVDNRRAFEEILNHDMKTPNPLAAWKLSLKTALEICDGNQSTLARRLDVNKACVCNWLAGTRKPGLDLMIAVWKIAERKR